MNEKYGIELELIMQKFNQKINKVKSAFKGIENKNIHVDYNGAELESVIIKMKELQGLLDANAKKPFMSSEEVLKTRVQLEKLNKQYTKLAQNQDNIKVKGSIGFNNMSKGVDQITSKIKRFGLALFSIRGIWSLVSKASSAYLVQDTELSDKLQSVWAGLGSMLAPIIEKIANILMKGVGYINIFIKALTGVDLLARASAKSMDKASKSAKGLNKSLAGFDELNNLDTSAGSNIDTGISNPFASIQNVDLPWAETVKAFGEWVKDNIPTVIGLLGGLAAGIIAIKTGLVEVLATKFETSTLAVATGIIMVVTGVIKLIGDLINYLKDPSWENFGKIITDIGIIIVGFGLIIGSVPAVIGGAIAIIVGLIVSNWEKIRQFLQNGIDWLISKTDWVKENFGIVGEVIYKYFIMLAQHVLNTFNGVFTGLKGIFDGILNVFKGIFTGDMKRVLEGFKQIFKGVFDALYGIAKAPLNLIISGINTLINGANKIKFDVPDWVPGFGGKKFGFNIPQIPRLNVGTNYVPEDQLAYIHKGEAVVPKKFNSKEYFGNGNEQTNELIERVIEAIENIEITPYTTIKDVGQASVKYINNKNRQLGRSVI